MEQKLKELAAYHVGLFTGAASNIDNSPEALAHALFILIAWAKAQREIYLLESL